jgi:hypothetical protein
MEKMRHKEEILRLRSEGKTYNEIKDILGCSKGTIAYHVGEGQKQKTRERTSRSRTLRKRILWEYKEKSGCVDCKEKYPSWMLDFDHRPGFEKIGSPTDLIHKCSLEVAMKEVEKCDVVCPNCHRIRSYSRNQFGYKGI